MMDVHRRAERKERSEERSGGIAADCLYVSEGITLGMCEDMMEEERKGCKVFCNELFPQETLKNRGQ